jgi:hypothetical protein
MHPRPHQDLSNSGTFAQVSQAFWRGVRSQFHPRMIFALFLPVIVTIVLTILLLWFGFTPLTEFIRAQIEQSALPTYVDPLIGAAGVLWLKSWLVPFIAIFMLIPIAGIVGLAVAAVWIMPWVLSHIASRNYPEIRAQGRQATLVSVWNAIWVSVVFVVGWLITLPLWLIPPLGLVLSLFWWTFAFTKMMRIDTLVDHANPGERKVILKQRNTGYWVIGFICALLNLFPPAWVFLPVFSGLVFAHYSLEAIRDVRR